MGRQTRGWALRVGLRPPAAAACHWPCRDAACTSNPLPLHPPPPRSRFLWVSSGEPHAIRRRELLSKYGEQIRKLYGYDHATAYQVGGGTSEALLGFFSCGVLIDRCSLLAWVGFGLLQEAAGPLLPAVAAGTLARQPPGWRLVGSAVSHAVQTSGQPASARALCQQQHMMVALSSKSVAAAEQCCCGVTVPACLGHSCLLPLALLTCRCPRCPRCRWSLW